MNLILIPDKAGKGRHLSLSHWQVMVLGVVLLLCLPVVVGVVVYQINGLLGAPVVHEPAYLVSQQQQLRAERAAIEHARSEAALHLDALAQRLGYLQAQVMRLNALGGRLTRMAGLDRREFDFSEDPAVGGPETSATPRPTVPDFMQTLDELATDIEQKSAKLNALETFLLDRKLKAEVTPRGWPVTGGWISSGFGRRADPFTGHTAYHEGVDIADRMGSPIRAMAAGVVSWAGPREGYGLLVEINHGNGQFTRYGHASAVLVRVGDRVEKGQSIALVGSTGRSTGPHVHFEVIRDGQHLNPLPYLQADKS
jgi:murein DD-endopeptidase MepM/ murein hydrolase activator NlpD